MLCVVMLCSDCFKTWDKLVALMLIIACNTEFCIFVILGDESIRLVRLCLQVKTFRFIIKGLVL